MIMEVYSVLDRAVQTFLPPVFVRARGEMVRSFMDAVGSSEHQFAKHLDDYVLYYLGRFDDVSGRFDGVEPSRVCSARECSLTADQSPIGGGRGNSGFPEAPSAG